MRLLVVSHYFAEHRGGVEIIAREVATRLAARGIDVTWAASGCDMPQGDGLRFLPMAACNLSERLLGVPYPVWSPGSLLRLRREIDRCDVVHLHDCLYMGNVYAHYVGRHRGRPVVVTQHIGIVPYASRLLRGAMTFANRTLGRRVLEGASACVFYSEKAQRHFSHLCFRRPPLFVANGVAPVFRPAGERDRRLLRAERGLEGSEPLLLFVGRFVEKKGLDHVRRLAAATAHCRWVLAGWGPIDPARWGLANVTCLGSLSRAELLPWYQAADLLVLPSVGEGFPLVIQEAMACGTPVLMSEDTARGFGAVRDVSFVSGLDAGELATSLRRALDDPAALAARRPRVARFAAEHWDWERCADRYESLLRELAPAGEKGAG